MNHLKTESGGRSVRVLIALGISAVMATAGCGTRVKTESAAQGLPSMAASSTSLSDAGVAPDSGAQSATPAAGLASSGSASGAVATPQTSASGATPAAASPGAAVSDRGVAKTSAGATAGAPSGATSGRTASGGASSQGSGGTPNPTVPAVPRSGPGSPVLVAISGTVSGPIGAVTRQIREGAQVWIKSINQRGGLNGHKVEALLYDDGGDPSRATAQAREAIEQKHVVAFLAMMGVFTGQSTADYINSKGIPVIGGDSTEFVYASPMHFPQVTSFPYALYATYPGLKQVLTAGEKKVGVLTCTEVNVCTQGDRIWSAEGAKEGFEVVYRGRASVAQPDYTAECLSAKRQGAEILIIGLDTQSLSRIVGSCARQGYRPRYATLTAVVSDRLKDDPNLDGLVASVLSSPYFQTGTPATDEFHAAMKAFVPGAELAVGHSLGWTAGKLFEKAAANLPEPPTSQAILEGLYSLKDDTLGGLTAPLNFVRGKTAPPVLCWFNIMIQKKNWVSPDNFKQNCRPVTGS